MLCPPQPRSELIENWLSRHRHPVSFALHMVGIPATILGALLTPIYLPIGSLPIFGLAAGLFLGGYAIQFLGHAIEGSEVGELIVARRLWKRSVARRAVSVPSSQASRGVA